MSRPLKKLKLRTLAVLAVFLVFSSASIAQAAPASGQIAAQDYIVVFKANSNVTKEFNSWKDRRFAVREVFRSAIRGMSLRADSNQVKQLLLDPDVLYVERDAVFQSQTTQSGAPWGIDRIGQRNLPLDGSYSYGFSGAGVNVYVVDTGIMATHTEFSGRLLPGFSSVRDRFGTNDCDGHGTHVAGTIGGTTYGVAKSVNLTPVRVLDCNGSGTTSGVLSGLDWIAKRTGPGTNAVVNISLGGSFSRTLNDGVQSIINRGIPVVVAAGNSSRDACRESPGSAPNAITVAATDINDNFASYSNRGSCVDILAPGTNVLSAYPVGSSGSMLITGTSMASPHVAGAMALMFANGYRTPAQLEATLLASATSSVVSRVPFGTVNKLLFTEPGGQTPSVSPSTQTLTGNVGSPVLSNALTATNLAGTLSYSISPALVDGLSFDTATGVISGTPSATSNRSHTITATNGTTTVTATVTVVISPSLVPLILPGVLNVTATVGVSTSSPPFTASGPFTGTVGYVISPALPAGLSFSSQTGQISGTPSATRVQTSYTVTASGSSGPSATATIILTVLAGSAISPASQVISTTTGTAISTASFTSSGNFVGPISYSLSGTLPQGLTFNTSNGQITGTPSSPLTQTSFIVTATGSSSGIASATITLTITGSAVLATPGAPTDVSATPSFRGRANLSWSSSEDNGSPITSHTLRVYEVRGASVILVRTVLIRSNLVNFSVSGLTRGRQYQFTVSATNRHGASPESVASNTIFIRS